MLDEVLGKHREAPVSAIVDHFENATDFSYDDPIVSLVFEVKL